MNGSADQVPNMFQDELFTEMKWKEERIKEMFKQKGWLVLEHKTREEKKEKEMKGNSRKMLG